MRRVVQKAKLVTVQRQIVEYTCDFCGAVCGTRQNPKLTLTTGSSQDDKHYCKRPNHWYASMERRRQ
jgi:hypothetical protein